MEKKDIKIIYEETRQLCKKIQQLVGQGALEEADREAALAMSEYPHMPQPHNLMGIILERQGDHIGAKKHFRAACALDPSYQPARANMEKFGTYGSFNDKEAYDEEDCKGRDEIPKMPARKIVYDENGIGHVVWRK